MRTVCVTGAASVIGRATRTRLEAEGQRVISVDLHDADLVADLGTCEGRACALKEVLSERPSYVAGQTIFVDGGTDAFVQPTGHPHPLG